MSAAFLRCGHCDGPAIYGDAHGLFYDGEGERCVTCGMPGSVLVDNGVGDDEEDNTASWDDTNENGVYCRRPDCAECAELRHEDAEVNRNAPSRVAPATEGSRT